MHSGPEESRSEPVLTFGIPLRTSDDEAEWRTICRLLSATLRSVYNQTDPGFRIIVAGGRRPDLDISTDDRFEFIAVNRPPPSDHNAGSADAAVKRQRIARCVAERGGGLLMILDADDLVSKRLVGYVRETGHPHGYIFEQGYALDPEAERALALPHRQFGNVPFHKICGSSFIVRLSADDFVETGRGTSRHARIFRQGHASVAEETDREGRPLMRVPFPAAVYLVDTGINLQAQLAREDSAARSGRQYFKSLIRDRGFPAARLADEFALRPAQSRGEPVLTFGIPLRSTNDTQEWVDICRLLSATLRSVYSQTDPAFRILVACDRRPTLGIETDDRLHFIDMNEPIPTTYREGAANAGIKRRTIVERFIAMGGGYLMLLDHDDLVSNRLVGYVRTTAHPAGYLIDRGYALDPGTLTVLPLPHPGFGDVAFDKICGSSAILRWSDPGEVVGTEENPSRYRRLRGQGHSKTAAAAEAEGRPLLRVPFPAVIYVVDPGPNQQSLLAREDESAAGGRRYLKRLINERGFPVARIAAEFGLADGSGGPPRLSIIIATFARPESLRRLLSALVPQITTVGGREIIVINDGSPEAGYEELRSQYAGIIRYRLLPGNQGVAAARTAGVEMASGDFVVFIDDDCEPPRWWLDWLSAVLLSEPDLDIVAGTSRPLWPARRGFFARVEAHYKLTPRPLVRDGVVLFVTANVAIRHSLLLRQGGFGFPGFLGTGEDTEMASRLSLAGARVRTDPDWYVLHEVGRGFVRLCRRFWNYGYGNGAAARLTTMPSFDSELSGYGRSHHLRMAVRRYREHRRRARGFSTLPLARIFSSAAATLISLAYMDGWAAAVRRRRRRAI